MKRYKKVLAFYTKLMDIIDLEDKELPYQVAIEAIELFDEVKDLISLPEFTAEEAKALHTTWDLREDYAEAAFRDLAQYLRDPEARTLVECFFSCCGTADGDDVYAHIKKVRLLGKDGSGPAVVTLVVHGYENFKALLSDDKADRPTYVHRSLSNDKESIGVI